MRNNPFDVIPTKVDSSVSNPFKTTSVFSASATEVNTLISEVFNCKHSFSIVADQEASNGSVITLYISGHLVADELAAVAKFSLTGRGDFVAGALLNYLASLGFLEIGEYFIRVDW